MVTAQAVVSHRACLTVFKRKSVAAQIDIVATSHSISGPGSPDLIIESIYKVWWMKKPAIQKRNGRGWKQNEI